MLSALRTVVFEKQKAWDRQTLLSSREFGARIRNTMSILRLSSD
jgi:hypothetical protein